MPPPQMLLCTVGTSLFRPNLEGLTGRHAKGALPEDLVALADAYGARNWDAVAAALLARAPDERTCGAEINSIASLVQHGHVPANVGLTFFHSDTPDGHATAQVLRAYYRARGHAPVDVAKVEDLQDADPKRFRTRGLRNLARELCRVVRERSAAACAVNATGGYKAQIAVAVLLGQALGVPVYYKHEQFPEIIAFPPLPVAFDISIWMRASGLLSDLERSSHPVPFADHADDWDERYESLVERVAIDGRDYLELSATGQIFHETFRPRFRQLRERLLPAPVPANQKRPPRLEKAGWPGQHPEVERYMRRVTDEVGPVRLCSTFDFNPNCPGRTRFVESRGDIVGHFSDGTYLVKFRVETTATTEDERAAVVAALNEWLAERT